MILTGQEIERQLGDAIVIRPFKASQLNPNSVNLHLHDELLMYEELVLDMKKPSRMRRIEIPDDGFVIAPHHLYLGRTVEWTETHSHVPVVQARASVAHLGLFVQVTAGFGNVGYCGHWTLQMFAVQPVKIYPGVPICQIAYHQVTGDHQPYKSDKYQNNHDVQPSMLYKELCPNYEDPEAQLTLGFQK